MYYAHFFQELDWVLAQSISKQIVEAYSKPCTTSKMNLFAKITDGYKGEFETLLNMWDEAFARCWVNPEACQTSKMKLLAKTVKS